MKITSEKGLNELRGNIIKKAAEDYISVMFEKATDYNYRSSVPDKDKSSAINFFKNDGMFYDLSNMDVSYFKKELDRKVENLKYEEKNISYIIRTKRDPEELINIIKTYDTKGGLIDEDIRDHSSLVYFRSCWNDYLQIKKEFEHINDDTVIQKHKITLRGLKKLNKIKDLDNIYILKVTHRYQSPIYTVTFRSDWSVYKKAVDICRR